MFLLFQRKLSQKKIFKNISRQKSSSLNQGFDLSKWSKRFLVLGSVGISASIGFGLWITSIYTQPVDFPGIDRNQFLPEPLKYRFLFAVNQEELQLRNKIIQENSILKDCPETRLVAQIAYRLLNSSQIPRLREIKWKIIVLDRPNQMTAFCMENGSIYITSGSINLAKNVEEIAFVLAHEIAHVAVNHGFERFYYNYIPFAADPRRLRRIQEDEADYIGLMLCSRACYNPNKAIHYFETTSARAGIDKIYDQTPHCAFDHHHPQIRTENLKRLLPRAHQEMKDYECPRRFE
jgi:hypothetical protein